MSSVMKERFGGKAKASSPRNTDTRAAGESTLTSLDSVVDAFVAKWTPEGYTREDIVWFNVFFLAVVHVGALYGIGLALTVPHGLFLAALGLGILWPISGLGITMGVHRLWSHKSYQAHIVVRIALAMVNSMAYQGSIFEWARDHRVHHMGSETPADPYNAADGMFHAHMGWVMLRKRPEVIAAGKKLDLSDLTSDPVVTLQQKYYLPSVLVFCYALPTMLGYYYTGNAWASFWILGVFRHVFVLHCTWCVNSLAHAISHGYRPYNNLIHAAENLVVSLISMGEGWHNFHHAFPTDYRAAEGLWWQFNPSTMVIDFLALFGLVWGRRATSLSLVAKHRQRTADRIAKGINLLQHDHTVQVS
ncbi:acyl-CoA desaturase 1 [Thecamonas trahens ATCC 50062]|uniref:Acyl-CoA desaturase 1 n=1 Tax=Thecamonas trahens ATCC 50062 TaxID=461836 RepID=A0A0L0D5R9_THETB|nr:acyl-CoA desaturase 1 [Thecamonas trahens ATCC 50062]KNC47550.1 acyl-CoA desaturase 1 [Thecamonas trahens ATCC 50062]|eukprot:XP_013759482.1 acyl-CoA desaturase 1 [Thecamonas trahens ATCC 50062]